MPDTPFRADHPKVDPGRTRPRNAFDAADGYSGQEYDITRERAEGAGNPSGSVGADASRRGVSGTDASPPDAAEPARVDPESGQVHGAGKGTGGGAQGEDHDDDSKGGGGNIATDVNATPAGAKD